MPCLGKNEAISFGERSKLLKIARQRINSPGNKYINHIWGEKEFGGTSVIYISDVDLSGLGFNQKQAASIPELTEPLIEKTPVIGLSVACSLIGINWIVRRRNQLAKEKTKEQEISTDKKGDNENAE